jgi:hypothetical protein
LWGLLREGTVAGFLPRGICAGWLPSAILMYYGGMSGVSLLSDRNFFSELGSDEGYAITVRLSIAGAFLFPGVVAIIGGSCGGLIYNCFDAEPAEKPVTTSKSGNPFAVVESRVTPLAGTRADVRAQSPDITA